MKKVNFLLCAAAFFIVTACQTNDIEPETIQDLIRQGKTEEAKTYFSTKSDINEQDKDGNTVLHCAALTDNEDLISFLLAKGADTEIKNFQSQTPLISAIDNNCYDSVRILTNARADIFAKNADRISALELALSKGDVYYDLMINSSTAAMKDTDGKTIIHYFVESKNEKALEYAVKKNLPLDEADNSGKTPLSEALSETDDIQSIRMANTLLLSGAEEIGGDTQYFEDAVLSRNYSLVMEDGQTPLHFAAIKNHSGIAEFLLENKANTASQDINGSTPLHEACRYGNAKIAELLLKARANVNAQDSLCKTPLMLIIPEENRFEIYSLLIKYNADVNHKDMFGDTVLHTASMTNINTDILELLCNAGADVNIRNKKGNTALATAVEHKLKEQIKFYINHNADIHAENARGMTPYTTVLAANDGLFETIVNPENINSVDSKGNTPLLIAVQKNAPISKIKYLLLLNSNVNARNREGNAPLYYAVQGNQKDTGLLLLEHGANIFSANTKDVSPLKLALTDTKNDWLINPRTIMTTDGSGNTPLHYAADWKLSDAAEFLIQKGAKVDAKNANGQTPLFNAAKSDDIQIIHALLKSGADINARDQLGSTPLHAAVRWNALQSAQTLIDLGLSPNTQNIAGKTPLAEAAVEGNIAMAALLLQNGANPNTYDITGKTALVDAIKGNQPQMISLLLKNKANPQMQDMNGRTPYHEAAESANLEIIKILCQAKSNPLSRDREGRTPLSISFDKGTDVMKAVLGTDKNITDSDGNTPVHIAIASGTSSKTVSYLIKSGYPFDTRNSSGYTPLALAVTKNEIDSANVLLENGASPFAEINSRGDNVLTLAFKEKNSEILGYIVKYSGKKSDIKGNTILHYAAKFGDLETVTRLLSFNLNKAEKNLAGETPYEVALNWKHNEIAELLK